MASVRDEWPERSVGVTGAGGRIIMLMGKGDVARSCVVTPPAPGATTRLNDVCRSLPLSFTRSKPVGQTKQQTQLPFQCWPKKDRIGLPRHSPKTQVRAGSHFDFRVFGIFPKRNATVGTNDALLRPSSPTDTLIVMDAVVF